ncbi:hypothetical protein DP897_04660 [Escherichia coli]|nr:hypothetical protein [Escherichia coli]EFO1438005.1 hypothetical protein [Escherichia coli]EFO2010273.1 hypothetical protein [Escherichia coli]THJ98632.1 hypothetical protein DIZ28_12795 [Escherichia coli]
MRRLTRLIRPTGSTDVGRIRRSRRIRQAMPDATLTRLIRPTGSTDVGRIRRLRRIRQAMPDATLTRLIRPTGDRQYPEAIRNIRSTV